MVAGTGQLTYREYLEMPETNRRYEIIDGELRMTPSPTVRHQQLVARIWSLLHRIVSERGLGEVLLAPLDVVIEKGQTLRTRQPDVLFISNERMAAARCHGVEFERLSRLEVAPDLLIEVLSPDESQKTIRGKLQDYGGIGVKEGWLVSPEAETIEVVDLTDSRIATLALLGIHGTLTSSVLDDLPVTLKQVFG